MRHRLTPVLDPLESRALLAPIIQPIADQWVEEGEKATVQIQATGSGPITWGLTVAPASATIDPVSGLFQWQTLYVQQIVTFQVEAIDATGTSTASFRVLVFDQPPIVNAGENLSLSVGQPINPVGSFNDPDPDSWVSTVDYGDGTGQQSLPLDGKSFILNHTYTAPGQYLVTVIVTDSQQRNGYGYFLVTVSNQPPAPTQGVPLAAGGEGFTLSAPAAAPPPVTPGQSASVLGRGTPSSAVVVSPSTSAALAVHHRVHRPHVHFPQVIHKAHP